MMRLTLQLTCVLLLFSNLAHGESPVEKAMTKFVGTLSITSQPYFAGGSLQGCTLVFSTLYQDWIYRQGALLRVDGNIGVMATSRGQIGTNLKVVVNEMQFDSLTPEFSPSAPSRAYLVGPNLTTNLSSFLQKAESDTPGAFVAVFQLSPTFEMLMQGIDTNELTIAFNNLGGKSDIQMKLALDVADVNESGERVRSPKMKTEFLGCLQSLFNSRMGETGAKGDLHQ